MSSGATDAAPQNQSAHYDLPDDTSPTRSFSYDSSSHQLDIQDFQSNSTPNFTLASKDDYSLDVSDQPSPTGLQFQILRIRQFSFALEDNSSFNRYDDGSSSPSLPDQSSFVAKDNLSALHALNARRQQEIAEMEVVEKQKIEELRQQAKKDLEHWYEERRIQMEQKRRTMKQEEQDSFTQALEKSDKQSCDWAKVIRLLDFSQGTQITKQKRDINRMRAVIVQVKRDRDGSKSENGV